MLLKTIVRRYFVILYGTIPAPSTFSLRMLFFVVIEDNNDRVPGVRSLKPARAWNSVPIITMVQSDNYLNSRSSPIYIRLLQCDSLSRHTVTFYYSDLRRIPFGQHYRSVIKFISRIVYSL